MNDILNDIVMFLPFQTDRMGRMGKLVEQDIPVLRGCYAISKLLCVIRKGVDIDFQQFYCPSHADRDRFGKVA